MTTFDVDTTYLGRFDRKVVGDIRTHVGYWIPAEDLDEFSLDIVGPPRVISAFTGSPPRELDVEAAMSPDRRGVGAHQRAELKPAPASARDTVVMIEVRRDDDNELCGFVDATGDGWVATTVFGADLRRCGDYDEAVGVVLDEGLASLADHWVLTGPDVDGEQVVCIQAASPGSVTLALDYYPVPGVPSMTLSSAELHSGPWKLVRSR